MTSTVTSLSLVLQSEVLSQGYESIRPGYDHRNGTLDSVLLLRKDGLPGVIHHHLFCFYGYHTKLSSDRGQTLEDVVS